LIGLPFVGDVVHVFPYAFLEKESYFRSFLSSAENSFPRGSFFVLGSSHEVAHFHDSGFVPTDGLGTIGKVCWRSA
jgi:hypothetical protein